VRSALVERQSAQGSGNHPQGRVHRRLRPDGLQIADLVTVRDARAVQEEPSARESAGCDPRVDALSHVSVVRVALAVCLLFDRRSERAVRALWDRLERAGVPSLRSHTHGQHLPHVSYAVLRTWDLAAVSAAVAGLGPVAPVELTFDGVGLFRRGRAWLLAGAAAEFVTRQERVVDAVIGTGAELHKHYRPGRWLPHCSVAPRASLAQLPVLAAVIYDVLPLEARLDRIALIDSATGKVWPVAAVWR
jgi:2'-5' RNA ligase